MEQPRMVPRLRSLVRQLVIAGLFPIIAYALLRPHMSSDAVALAIVMVFPAADVLGERVWRGRFEPIGIIVLAGICIGLIGALALHGDPLLLKMRESLLTGVFGLVCLLSLAAPRPAMFYLGRAFATGGDPARPPNSTSAGNCRPSPAVSGSPLLSGGSRSPARPPYAPRWP
jgi:hypothetical protein